MQKIFVDSLYGLVQIDLPPAGEEVLPAVRWGDASGFPTVAYWLLRVLERRIAGNPVEYKLGSSLLEEIGACLLGGHGIPAENGLAAYKHLRSKGVFAGASHSQEEIVEWLSEPISLNGKYFRYRFAKQKTRYLHLAIDRLSKETPPLESGQALRDWLLQINGIGPKTASWITRNWLGADDIAILDIHIYRAGLLGGFFDKQLTVEKNYFELEKQFIDLAESMKVRTSELDAVIWLEMKSSPSARRLLSLHDNKKLTGAPPNNRYTDPQQVTLI